MLTYYSHHGSTVLRLRPLNTDTLLVGLAACGEWLSTWVMVFGGGTGIEAVGPKIVIWSLMCYSFAAAYV
jgi:hypothetical protein